MAGINLLFVAVFLYNFCCVLTISKSIDEILWVDEESCTPVHSSGVVGVSGYSCELDDVHTTLWDANIDSIEVVIVDSEARHLMLKYGENREVSKLDVFSPGMGVLVTFSKDLQDIPSSVQSEARLFVQDFLNATLPHVLLDITHTNKMAAAPSSILSWVKAGGKSFPPPSSTDSLWMYLAQPFVPAPTVGQFPSFFNSADEADCNEEGASLWLHSEIASRRRFASPLPFVTSSMTTLARAMHFQPMNEQQQSSLGGGIMRLSSKYFELATGNIRSTTGSVPGQVGGWAVEKRPSSIHPSGCRIVYSSPSYSVGSGAASVVDSDVASIKSDSARADSATATEYHHTSWWSGTVRSTITPHGFHREMNIILEDVSGSIPTPSTSSSSSAGRQNCSVAALLSLPSSLYVDMDELRSLHTQFGAPHPKVHLYTSEPQPQEPSQVAGQDMNVELPEMSASPRLALFVLDDVEVEWVQDSNSSSSSSSSSVHKRAPPHGRGIAASGNLATTTLTIPIHARYHAAANGTLYTTAYLPHPRVYVCCGCGGRDGAEGVEVKGRGQELPAGGGGQFRISSHDGWARVWPKKLTPDGAAAATAAAAASEEGMLEVRVPIGQLEDKLIVRRTTVTVTFLATSLVMWVIIQPSVAEGLLNKLLWGRVPAADAKGRWWFVSSRKEGDSSSNSSTSRINRGAPGTTSALAAASKEKTL